MDITWHGLGCFTLKERGYPTVVTDPFDPSTTGLRLPQGVTDIVTWSTLLEDPNDARWPELRGEPHTLASPGEYEIGGVFITGIASASGRSGRPGENIIFMVNYGGEVVCHLGEPSQAPTQAQVEAMGRVHVLLVPVGTGGGFTLAKASETVSLVEPDVVIPMQYQTPDLSLKRDAVEGFLKEMGVTQPTVLPSLKVAAGVESEETQIVLLEPRA